MKNQEIVSKLWNLCNVLRDDGITYHQYVTELTYILFLKMMKETENESNIMKSIVKKEEETLDIETYSWDSFVKKQGVELKKYYNTILGEFGENCTGRIREIYAGARSNIDEPKNLEKIIKTIHELD